MQQELVPDSATLAPPIGGSSHPDPSHQPPDHRRRPYIHDVQEVYEYEFMDIITT